MNEKVYNKGKEELSKALKDLTFLLKFLIRFNGFFAVKSL